MVGRVHGGGDARAPSARTRAYGATVLTALAVLLGAAGAPGGVRLDNWDSYPAGRLELTGTWRAYPSADQKFKQAPAIVRDGERAALLLKTDNEPMRIGRVVKIDPRETPWLTWEWKAVKLPEGGDVRDTRRNDQAGRVMVMFDGMRGLLYVWDTMAPIGAESISDGFELFRRALIVVRSGAQSIGQWERQRRNVYADYRRIFDAEPRTIKWVGLESHSNDTHTSTEVLFGAVRFDAR